MAERLQAGGRDQEPDEAGEVTSGLDARGRGDGHGGHDLGQVPRGPSHACASCVWARVRPRVSCSTAHEPSACRVRRGVWGGARQLDVIKHSWVILIVAGAKDCCFDP